MPWGLRSEAPSNDGAHRFPLLEAPELPVIFFSFLLHFVWEFLQAPTYVGMMEMKHWDGIKLCLSATFGDAGFALVAFWIASMSVRDRNWIGARGVCRPPYSWPLASRLPLGLSTITPM
ncbi:hypothetical protein [Mesorhizobium sp. J428]|uniref:hypothetical protein n=1 Tax=Mesorhizobium sp. J428 TaxID=2898440 RepID=UPI002151D66B|nr:hypothetical protein [Mesorhizobium sp. J428]MCR5860632.1 hypothetical protein [Mesorhizobium sp. J428]